MGEPGPVRHRARRTTDENAITVTVASSAPWTISAASNGRGVAEATRDAHISDVLKRRFRERPPFADEGRDGDVEGSGPEPVRAEPATAAPAGPADAEDLDAVAETSPPADLGRTLDCVNPATGRTFDVTKCADPDDIDAAVDAGVLASALWRGSPFDERRRCLQRLATLLYEQADGIAELIAQEQGKPVVEALHLEVLPALDHLRYVALHAEDACIGEPIQPRHPLHAHKRAFYLYEPVGLVAVVTPYNLPFLIPAIHVGTAVAMGNAVLVKPSELAPLSALRLGDLCAAAGFPPGLVHVLPTRREDALYVVAHPRVDKVFITGAPGTGQQVMATAGCIPRPAVLSLGGKHASVVAADADVDRAARGIAWGALANAGQNCGAVERVYVEEPVATRFLERIVREVNGLHVGDPLSPEVDIGPLITAAHRERVHADVVEAVDGGARLLTGGEIPEGPGFFYPPTIVLGPPPEGRLMNEETLGPVIPITVVESLERAILLANENDHALSASGWTTSPATADRLMIGLQASVVTINDVLYQYGEPAAIKSGYRLSGLGHVQGVAGLREMCRRKFASFDHLPAESPVFAYPYDSPARMLARLLLRRLHGPGRTGRIRALASLFLHKRFRGRVPTRFFLHRSRSRLR